jgi:allantoate deiminase
MIELANRVIQCCRDLAACTEEAGRTTRTFLSPPMHEVHRILGDWMRRVGMQVSVDAAGNLRGVRAGSGASRLVIGSHLDTVPNAGAFDGILGVVMGVALVETLGQTPIRSMLPTIEVIGFSEEEGVRFGIPFIGSRTVAGTLDETILKPGVVAAIEAFGLDPNDLPAARLGSSTGAYLEFHIEQGPVLESLDLPLGIVDAIAGQSRRSFTFSGKANHAGTTPMSLRRDALTAAAEWICSVEKLAARTPGLVATTGSIAVEPNATNVISGIAHVSLDVRHSCDATRLSAVAEMIASAVEICKRRGIELDHDQRLDQSAVEMNADLRNTLARAVMAAGYSVHNMTSGAGHDAMILAPHVPSAMLFLRSPGGISHHPDESVIATDVAAALAVGVRFIQCMNS